MKLLDRNTLLSLNKDPKSINLHDLVLSRMKNARVNPDAVHDFVHDRMRTKKVKNMDEVFNKLNDLKKNGVLDLWQNKFNKPLKESTELNSSAVAQIEQLLETVASGAGPFASFGAGPSIESSYAKPTIIKDCTHQDIGASKECKKLRKG